MSTKTKWPYAPIKEPIDFYLLEKCYIAERWRWHLCGIPSAATLNKHISETIEELKSPYSSKFCGSGGIYVDCRSGETKILIHGKLFRHYEEATLSPRLNPEPKCKIKCCHNPCEYYGPNGGYSIQCEMHNNISRQKRSERRKIVTA